MKLEKQLVKRMADFVRASRANFAGKQYYWFSADLRKVFNETGGSYSIYSVFIPQYEIILYK